MELLKSFENLGRDLRDAVLRLLRDYSEALGLAILMAVILRFFVFGAYKISNPTMEPNLKLGDFVIGYKLPYGVNIPFSDAHVGHSAPRRGEVIVFRCPKTPETYCVKRAVGLPGDRVEIKGKRLIVPLLPQPIIERRPRHSRESALPRVTGPPLVLRTNQALVLHKPLLAPGAAAGLCRSDPATHQPGLTRA